MWTRCARHSLAVVVLGAALLPVSGHAQAPVEVEAPAVLDARIRRLEAEEARGLLHRDSLALRGLWARDFTVNSPRNSIVSGAEGVIALIRNGTIDYTTFDRQIETVLVYPAVVIVMGAETVTPVNRAPLAGRTVQRRFSHVWMRRDGQWRLTARHANVITPP